MDGCIRSPFTFCTVNHVIHYGNRLQKRLRYLCIPKIYNICAQGTLSDKTEEMFLVYEEHGKNRVESHIRGKDSYYSIRGTGQISLVILTYM